MATRPRPGEAKPHRGKAKMAKTSSTANFKPSSDPPYHRPKITYHWPYLRTSKATLNLSMADMMIILGGCKGEVYKVGGCSGWTNVGPLHYKSWAAAKIFHVGDTLLFEYNKQFHNVVRVTHKNLNTCNSTAPYATWATGNDFFTITRPAHFYFICSFPDHCQSSQKVDIRVLKDRKPGPAPSPLPLGPSPQSSSTSGSSPRSPLASGPSSVSVPPVQSPRSGCSSLHSSWKFWVLAVAIGLLAIAS
ncbi:hypothetical protein Pfo_011577 [Paulownia fortunei]|nr:hypothetical protein Pfo_011577 [Paulownia fortunei]